VSIVRFVCTHKFPCGCVISRYRERVSRRERLVPKERVRTYTQERGAECELSPGEHGRALRAASDVATQSPSAPAVTEHPELGP
jgi:hypothetical protein